MKYILFILSLFLSQSSFAHKNSSSQDLSAPSGKWIWYPGEFEVWLNVDFHLRRFPPNFWRIDSPYGLVRFEKTYETSLPDTVQISSDGDYHAQLTDGSIRHFDSKHVILPVGKHHLTITVTNFKTFPSLIIKGKRVFTDESWMVTNQNNIFYNAASAHFSQPQTPPSAFKLEYTPITSKIIERNANSMLVDFGKETFGKVILENITGKGKVKLYYGESKPEALAATKAESFENLKHNTGLRNDTTEAQAFRYIYAVWDSTCHVEKISALYEYLPLENKGGFSCSDTLLNRIYDVSLYTLHLNTREFHIDGIKRDRWVWSGDAYQSYLMNFYTFFDEDVNKRTLYALRGHDPVETHINTILDYSFYWMIGIHDQYLYTGDSAFVKQIYPRMKSLMEFCLNRANKNGFVEGLPEDWVFIDWANIEKEGEVSFEQLLLVRSLEAMAVSADLANDKQYAEKCRKLSKDIKQKIFDVFWSDKKNAFLHNRKGGIVSDVVTRYTNMFAVLFDYVDNEKKQSIKNNVILNDSILGITTPYMKFYELASLCEIGEKEKAINFVKDYWGGMLKLGATTFWELYDPKETGNEIYAMYGRPFGRSLCHAWGANPVYLFGKYLLGVKPTSPGYKSYLIEPSLAGLDWIKGRVPTPNGNIEVYMNKTEIKIKTVQGKGILRIKSKETPKVEQGVTLTKINEDQYEIQLAIPQKEYTIRYW